MEIKDIIDEEIQSLDEGRRDAFEVDKLSKEVQESYTRINKVKLGRLYRDLLYYKQNDLEVDLEELTWGLSTAFSLYDYTESGYNEIREFLEFSRVIVRLPFTYDIPKHIGGYFDGKRRMIVVKTNEIFERLDILIKSDQNLDEEWFVNVVGYAFNNYIRTSLIHEIQHAIDDYRSNSMYHSDKKSNAFYSRRKYDDEYTRELHDLYLQLPHEYWARFAQYINSADFRVELPFKTVYQIFKERFTGYDVLEDDDRKRLSKALYVYYQKALESKKSQNKDQ